MRRLNGALQIRQCTSSISTSSLIALAVPFVAASELPRLVNSKSNLFMQCFRNIFATLDSRNKRQSLSIVRDNCVGLQGQRCIYHSTSHIVKSTVVKHWRDTVLSRRRCFTLHVGHGETRIEPSRRRTNSRQSNTYRSAVIEDSQTGNTSYPVWNRLSVGVSA